MPSQLVFVEEPSGDSTQKYSSPHGKKSTVLVALSDANDNSPVFTPTQTSSFSLSEDARLGHSVGTITAEDADSADFGTVTFSFETDGDVGEFSISDEVQNRFLSLQKFELVLESVTFL